MMDPKPPNPEGQTMCLVRWIVQLPDSRLWLGAYHREAFDAYLAAHGVKAIPIGCQCDVNEWPFEISPICDQYVGTGGRCTTCEHDESCHLVRDEEAGK